MTIYNIKCVSYFYPFVVKYLSLYTKVKAPVGVERSETNRLVVIGEHITGFTNSFLYTFGYPHFTTVIGLYRPAIFKRTKQVQTISLLYRCNNKYSVSIRAFITFTCYLREATHDDQLWDNICVLK